MTYGLVAYDDDWRSWFPRSMGVRRRNGTYRLYTLTEDRGGYMVTPDHSVCRWYAKPFWANSVGAALRRLWRTEGKKLEERLSCRF
jgi:hypothetical protein